MLVPNSQNPQDPRLLEKVLGITNGANPFGNVYFDIAGTTVQERASQLFEQDPNARRMPEGVEPLSVEGWLMRGAIREDDVSIGGANPKDDPYGNIMRVLNHFYDPVNERPLNVGSGHTALGTTAPNWGIGTTNAFASPIVADPNRRNHFTVFDAREAMWRALTLKSRNPDGSYVDLGPSGSLTSKKDLRNAYWATTFRALGDVLHLNQDMAQPQHTRNDVHSGAFGPLSPSVIGHASIFEKYLDARATGTPQFKIDGTEITPAPLRYEGFPTPTFTKYSDFWSTNPGTGSFAGAGLADYSNSSFFSARTNLGSNSKSRFPIVADMTR